MDSARQRERSFLSQEALQAVCIVVIKVGILLLLLTLVLAVIVTR